ncbi:unnamed protein product, partial [Rangifer tarandus platyrhynchus]
CARCNCRTLKHSTAHFARFVQLHRRRRPLRLHAAKKCRAAVHALTDTRIPAHNSTRHPGADVPLDLHVIVY